MSSVRAWLPRPFAIKRVIRVKKAILSSMFLAMALLSGCGEDSNTPPRIMIERGVASQYVRVQSFGSVMGTVTEDAGDAFVVTITIKK